MDGAGGATTPWCWSRSTGWKLADVMQKRESSKVKAGGAVSRQRNAAHQRRIQNHLWPRRQALSWQRPSSGGWSGSGQHAAGRAKQGRLTMAWVPIMGGITVFSVYFHHTEERTERNQQILEAASREIRRCPGLWILAGDFNMEPETFGQYATPARLPGVLVQPAAPTFRHGASVRFFDYFVVHRAVACQIREVRVLEESGVSPHHPVQMKLKRSFQGLVTRVSPAIAHRWLCARTSLLGFCPVGEHVQTMDAAHAEH